MKDLRWKLRFLSFIGLASFLLVGCGQSESIPTSEIANNPLLTPSIPVILGTDPPASPTVLVIATQASLPTETLSPSPTPTVAEIQPTITPTTGPLCTVLTNLNLRSGPGTAYRPPLTALETGTELIPTGFNPVGVPGGPWVQVRVQGQELTGWVSAGEQYVSCNIELSTLAQVAVDPPPPPAPPRLVDSAPDGSFPEEWRWELDFNPTYLLRFKVYDESAGGSEDGDGIAEVNFTVIAPDGTVVLERTEGTAGFCIFGGGEPNCNPWIIEDYVYKWQAGGPAAASGDYQVNVLVHSSGNLATGNWRMTVNMQFP